MTECYLHIEGKPVAWMRRVPIGRGKAFSPKKMVDYKARVQYQFSREYPDHILFTGPVEVTILIDWPIPKSFSKKKRAAAMVYDIHPITKPDVDNLGKIVCDALNGVAYRDDAQVVRLTVEKRYAAQPCLYVTIMEIEEREKP